MLVRQPPQDLFRGLVLFGPGRPARVRVEFQFVEENVAQLPWGVEIEVFPRELEDLLPGPLDFAREAFGQVTKRAGFAPDALVFHFNQGGDERTFHVPEHAHLAHLFKSRPQDFAQLQGHVRILGRIRGHLVQRDIRQAQLVLAFFADEIGDRDGVVSQQRFRQIVHGAAQIGRGEVGGEHRVEQRTHHVKAFPAQDAQIELQVVTDFLDFRILQNGTKGLQDFERFFGHIRQWHVESRVGLA